MQKINELVGWPINTIRKMLVKNGWRLEDNFTDYVWIFKHEPLKQVITIKTSLESDNELIISVSVTENEIVGAISEYTV